jgi:hypothetical protein
MTAISAGELTTLPRLSLNHAEIVVTEVEAPGPTFLQTMNHAEVVVTEMETPGTTFQHSEVAEGRDQVAAAG